MEKLKIGKLTISKIGLLLIAFCLFLDGIQIGVLVAYNQSAGHPNNIMPLLIFTLILPFVLLYRILKKEITEL